MSSHRSASWIVRSSLFVLLLGSANTLPLVGQVSIDGHDLQFHGFFSQGFAYSSANNYLTMSTSKGSFAFTDAGLNTSISPTTRFRLGAQVYVRDVGELGRGHVSLDWASGDYRFNDWFGVRAGKVKTVFGLYNNTQDAEFLHTFALLPQSIYPIDMRANSISHLGGDIYGNISLRSLGSLSYTGYVGRLSIDRSGGYAYGMQATGLNPSSISGHAKGGDLKWTTPVPGLLVGASVLDSPKVAEGVSDAFHNKFKVEDPLDRRIIFSAQYTLGNLHLDSEYSRQIQSVIVHNGSGPYGPALVWLDINRTSWYASGSYRLSKHLELGAYNSRFTQNDNRSLLGTAALAPPARHIFDQTVTARIDLTKFWDLKIEGHFINGYGDPSSFLGFYPQNNPNGLQPNTNALIVRTGLNF